MKHPMVSLGSVAEFINGVAFKPSDWGEEGKKIVRIQNLTDPEKPFNRTTREVESKYVIHPGDLLVSWSATLGVFTWDDEETAIVNQHIFRVEPDEDVVDRSYLRHMLADALLDMERHLHGATMKHVNRSEFLSTQIPLPHKNGKPDLDEQKRIAALLDKADALRRKRQEALRLTDDFLRSTFLEMFGDPMMNQKAWPVVSLSAVANDTFRNGLSPSNTGQVSGRVMTLSAITSGLFRPECAKEVLFDRSPNDNQIVTQRDFLICRGNGNKELVGRGVVPTANLPGTAFPDTMIAVTPDGESIKLSYLEAIWSTSFIRRQIEAGARTTNGTFKVNQALLGSIEFPLPPLDMQQRFEKIGTHVQRKKSFMHHAMKETETLFSALQQRAFSGQL